MAKVWLFAVAKINAEHNVQVSHLEICDSSQDQDLTMLVLLCTNGCEVGICSCPVVAIAEPQSSKLTTRGSGPPGRRPGLATLIPLSLLGGTVRLQLSKELIILKHCRCSVIEILLHGGDLNSEIADASRSWAW